MFWWGSQPQGLAVLWIQGADLCVCVMGCREQEKDSHHYQPPLPWHTSAGARPELGLTPSHEYLSLRRSRHLEISIGSLCFLQPHFSQKKKIKIASSSFIKTYAFNHTSCLFRSGIFLYIPCRLAPLLFLALLPLKSAGFLTAAGAGFDSPCQTTGFLMEIEIISLNKQKHFLYLKCFIYISHRFSITVKEKTFNYY